MKKLLLLLLFIPLVSFGQDFSKIKNKIKYIKKFKSWEHFVDHFETREQVENFFGDGTWYNQPPGGGSMKSFLKFYGWESREDYIKHDQMYSLTLNSYTRYSVASSSSSGNLSYNSTSNSLDYNGSTTYSEGGSFNYTYILYFNFKRLGNCCSRPDRHSNIISSWEVSNDMKGISDRKFISLIRKYYSKKEEYQFKRKK